MLVPCHRLQYICSYMWFSCRILLVVLLMLPFVLWSQTGANPFDIVRSNDSVVAPSANVFEIQDRMTNDYTANPIQLPSNTTQIKDTISTLQTINNPFEVDHVPIRRKALSSKGEQTLQEEIKSSENFFILWIMIGCVLVLALIFNTGMPLIKRIIRSLGNENILKQVYRDSEKQGRLVFYILYGIYFVTGSSLIYLFLYHYDILDGFVDFTKVLASLLGLYMVRHAALWFLGWAFPVDKESMLFSFTILG